MKWKKKNKKNINHKNNDDNMKTINENLWTFLLKFKTENTKKKHCY